MKLTTESLKLIVPIASWEKIIAYVDICDQEITGFADAVYDVEREAFVVGDVYLLKQESQPAEVDMSAETIADFTAELIGQGATQLPQLWWHSHVNMGAFFSGTDRTAMEDLQNNSYSISLVVNKKREYSCTVTLYKPFPLTIDEVPLVIEYVANDASEALIAEVAEKVVKKVYSISPTPYHYPAHDNDFESIGHEPLQMYFGDKTTTQILALITSLDLQIDMDYETGEIIWVNPNTYTTWHDSREVLETEQPNWYTSRLDAYYEQLDTRRGLTEDQKDAAIDAEWIKNAMKPVYKQKGKKK